MTAKTTTMMAVAVAMAIKTMPGRRFEPQLLALLLDRTLLFVEGLCR